METTEIGTKVKILLKKKKSKQNKTKKHLYLRLPVMEKFVYRKQKQKILQWKQTNHDVHKSSWSFCSTEESMNAGENVGDRNLPQIIT